MKRRTLRAVTHPALFYAFTCQELTVYTPQTGELIDINSKLHGGQGEHQTKSDTSGLSLMLRGYMFNIMDIKWRIFGYSYVERTGVRPSTYYG